MVFLSFRAGEVQGYGTVFPCLRRDRLTKRQYGFHFLDEPGPEGSVSKAGPGSNSARLGLSVEGSREGKRKYVVGVLDWTWAKGT